MIDAISRRKVIVSEWDNDQTNCPNIKIVNGITLVDLPSRDTMIIKIHKSILLEESGNALIFGLRVCESEVEVDGRTQYNSGKVGMKVDDIFIPPVMKEGMMIFSIRQAMDKN